MCRYLSQQLYRKRSYVCTNPLVVRVVACSVHREQGYEWECTTSIKFTHLPFCALHVHVATWIPVIELYNARGLIVHHAASSMYHRETIEQQYIGLK